jgi:hypothetical protein
MGTQRSKIKDRKFPVKVYPTGAPANAPSKGHGGFFAAAPHFTVTVTYTV